MRSLPWALIAVLALSGCERERSDSDTYCEDARGTYVGPYREGRCLYELQGALWKVDLLAGTVRPVYPEPCGISFTNSGCTGQARVLCMNHVVDRHTFRTVDGLVRYAPLLEMDDVLLLSSLDDGDCGEAQLCSIECVERRQDVPRIPLLTTPLDRTPEVAMPTIQFSPPVSPTH